MMALVFIGQFHYINMIPNNQFWFNNKNSVDNTWSNSHSILGDSISYTSYGYCASGSYAKIVTDTIGVTYIDYAIPSTGIYESIKAAMQQTIPKLTSTSLMSGINDIRRENTPETFEMIKGGIITSLALLYAKNFKIFSNPSHFTTTGSWINSNGGLESKAWYSTGGTIGWMASNTLNGTLTGTFNNDKIAIGTYGQNAARGIFEIRVDGNLVKTFDCSGKANTTTSVNIGGFYYSPYAFILEGFGSGSHSIEIKNINGDYIFLDYLAELPSFTEILPPLFYLDIPHLKNSAYSMYSPYNNANEASIDALNISIENELIFFEKYKNFTNIKTNIVYNPNVLPSQVDSDGVHPNCLGSQNIANEIINKF